MNGLKQRINLTWQKSMAALYQVMGKYGKAANHLEALAEEGQAQEREWWILGSLYARQKQWHKAVPAFLNALKASSGSPKYIYWLGRAEEETGNGSAAEALYEQALRRDAEFWEAYSAKAQLLLNRGEYAQAMEYFSECLKHREGDPYLLNNLGLCCLGLEKPEEACRYLESAVRRKPGDGNILYNYGTALVRAGDYHKALLQFEGIKKNKNPAILNALGYCHSMLNNPEKSIDCYLEALKIEPDNEEAQKNLAAVYAQRQDYAPALELLKNLLLHSPKDPDLLNNIAWIYEALDQNKQAEENYFRSLAASEGNPDIAYNLICCLNKQGKYLEALELTSHLKRFPEKQRLYWSALARIYEDLGANRQAIDCYNKSLGLE